MVKASSDCGDKCEEPEDRDKAHNFSGWPDNKRKDRAFPNDKWPPRGGSKRKGYVYKVDRTLLAARETDGRNQVTNAKRQRVWKGSSRL